MQKILFISATLAKGGMERQLSYLINNLDPGLFSITLVLFENKIEFPIPEHVRVIVLRNKTKRLRTYLFWILATHRDAIICSRIVNEYVMLFCGLLLQKKLVLEIRSSGKRMGPYYKKLNRLVRLFRPSWTIVCNNRKSYEEVEKFNLTRNKLHLISNAVDSKYFQFSFKPGNKICKIGFIGRIDPVKNIEFLLTAFSLVTDQENYQLMIKGNQDTYPQYFATLKELSKQLDIHTRIAWEEESNNLLEFYHSLDILVLPSFSEGSPNVILESMASGCICICADPANSEALVKDQYTFSLDDPKELTELLVSISKLTSEERKVLVQENRTIIENQYSVGQMVDSFTSIFIEISK